MDPENLTQEPGVRGIAPIDHYVLPSGYQRQRRKGVFVGLCSLSATEHNDIVADPRCSGRKPVVPHRISNVESGIRCKPAEQGPETLLLRLPEAEAGCMYSHR